MNFLSLNKVDNSRNSEFHFYHENLKMNDSVEKIRIEKN